MESLLVLAVLVLLVGPILGIAAFIRSGRMRRLFDEQEQQYKSTVSALRGEIADLRRSLAKVTERLDTQTAGASSVQPPPPEAKPTEPRVAPVVALTPPPRPTPPMERPVPAEPVVTRTETPPRPPATEQPHVAPPKPTAPPVSHPVPPRPMIPPIGQSIPPRPVAPLPPVPPPVEQPRPSARTTVTDYAPLKATPPRKSLFEQLRAVLPMEEVLGMNWLSKIGIVLLVIGMALLGKYALGEMGPLGKVALLYAVAAAMLGGGIYVERKPMYELIGRTGIGGGWALLFFTTYAMHFVQAMQVMSQTPCCILMLIVAAAMVAHTLRYKSQLVTGLSFLLAFATVALSQDTVYALSAGAILAVGIVAIALRQGWYELEVFGILASYLNHLYWLWRIYPGGMAGHTFPEFWPSTIILILYWLTFRISYVARGIRSMRDEHVSTVAALLNTALLLAVMKFQSTRPQLAFYALLSLGALEFFFGQLPATRRRRSAFIILTVLGTVLMFAAVPFKFTGNNIALLWIIAAEVLIVAGIVQSEVVFRRLGLLTGLFTGLLIAYNAAHIIEFRQTSEAPLTQDGILLLTSAAVFYLNALFIRRKWSDLFGTLDGRLVTAHSYIGGVTAFIGAWGVFSHDWTAVAWGALMLAAAFGARRLSSEHLLWQCWALTMATIARAVAFNAHWDTAYPTHVGPRLITLPIVAAMFYLSAAVHSPKDSPSHHWLRSLASWSGTSMLVMLAYQEIAPAWFALVLMLFAAALALIGRRFKLDTLCHQEHVLALGVAIQLLTFNLNAPKPLERYLPFVVCAILIYAISRYCTVREAPYARIAAWAHTWAATGLLAALAWHESPEMWLAPLWAAFALTLAIFDRFFNVEELPYQAHVLAAFSVLSTVSINIQSTEKWHNVSLRLLTVSIVVLVLYALARWVRMPEELRKRDFHHVYSWVGSFLTAWMMWSELQPIAVAVGIAVFGLVLFEWGTLQKASQLRLQAYVALTAAFARLFFVNLTAVPVAGEAIGPRLYTVVPIALIYFFVWWQLQSEKAEPATGRLNIGDIIAYFGTGCITALIYFQTSPEWIVAAWAVAVMALMLASLLLDRRVFLHQATLLTVALVVRGVAHNLYGGSYFTTAGWRGNFAVLSATSAILLATLPIAFRLRKRFAAEPEKSKLAHLIAAAVERPDQLQFFAPALLITLMIALKMNPGMVTLAWGVEGVLVFMLALAVGQRSYRLTGLSLLLLCVGKIVIKDAWRLAERDRYITFIALGGALVLVSFLYSKYRDSVRQYL
jgi:uncharacterized membrane protein